jgi:hypothetical protein
MRVVEKLDWKGLKDKVVPGHTVTATSLVICYHLPSVSKSRIPHKKFDRLRASFP